MNASVVLRRDRLPKNRRDELWLRCQRCAGRLDFPIGGSDTESGMRECPRCKWVMESVDGIWRAICPGRVREIDASSSAYEAVREAEGRWSHNAEFYRNLPWRDTTGRFKEQWKIRAASFEFFVGRLLPLCSKMSGSDRLRVLDLGAGNCWMSYRLALYGHDPVAVDIGAGQKDGLGSAIFYDTGAGGMFPRFQAEMDWLPFADGQFDLAIYNASFHYARDYNAAVTEALRVLRPNGAILIVDSPGYPSEAEGEAMKREKKAEFQRRFGADSEGMGGQEYLTPQRLASLERMGLTWRSYSPWYGWRWAMRPVIARLKGRRRPSQFHIYMGTTAQYVTETK